MEQNEQSLADFLKQEAKKKGMDQRDLSKEMNAQDTNFWKILRKNTVKLTVLSKICKFFGLEIVLRNIETKQEFKINIK